MNPFLNPVFLGFTLKNYLVDIDRMWRVSPKKLQAYADKAFQKIVNYADTIPLYHDKYQQANIHPQIIQGLCDISRLPFISKQDFRRYYPQGLVPPGFDMQNSFLVSTSGSTGQPVSLYSDPYSIVKSLMGFIR